MIPAIVRFASISLAFCHFVHSVPACDDNPYDTLGLDPGTDLAEIKRKYRELSKSAHPDRGGNDAAFARIAIAYERLTDSAAMDEWEFYCNPDVPYVKMYGSTLVDLYMVILTALLVIPLIWVCCVP